VNKYYLFNFNKLKFILFLITELVLLIVCGSFIIVLSIATKFVLVFSVNLTSPSNAFESSSITGFGIILFIHKLILFVG
jgi:hypothetical protein